MPPTAKCCRNPIVVAMDQFLRDLGNVDGEETPPQEGEAAEEEEEPAPMKKPAGKMTAPIKKAAPKQKVATKPASNLKRPSSAIADNDDNDDGDDDNMNLEPQPGQKILRDRIKAAKMKSIWDLLPTAVQDAYTSAGKFKDGSARDRQSLIVNNLWKKKNGKYIMQDEHPSFQQNLEKYKNKYKDEANEGLPIYDLCTIMRYMHSSHLAHDIWIMTSASDMPQQQFANLFASHTMHVHMFVH